MQVILQSEVPLLGREGDVVKVAGGYANNYLLPKGLAVIATAGNLKQLEQKRAAIAKREAVVRGEAEAQAAVLSGKSITITAKAGAEGRLYGSITTKDIVAAIAADHDLTIDRRRIEPSDPIKSVGEVSIKARLYPGVDASIIVKVISDAPEAELAQTEEIEASEEAASAEEADKDEA